MKKDQLIILVLLLFNIVSAYLVAGSEVGMISSHGFYCRELMSSGSDDEILFALFCLLLTPIFVYGLIFRNKINKAMWPILLLSNILTWIVVIAGQDCGNMLDTVMFGNVYLLMFMVAQILLNIMLLVKIAKGLQTE